MSTVVTVFCQSCNREIVSPLLPLPPHCCRSDLLARHLLVVTHCDCDTGPEPGPGNWKSKSIHLQRTHKYRSDFPPAWLWLARAAVSLIEFFLASAAGLLSVSLLLSSCLLFGVLFDFNLYLTKPNDKCNFLREWFSPTISWPGHSLGAFSPKKKVMVLT